MVDDRQSKYTMHRIEAMILEPVDISLFTANIIWHHY